MVTAWLRAPDTWFSVSRIGREDSELARRRMMEAVALRFKRVRRGRRSCGFAQRRHVHHHGLVGVGRIPTNSVDQWGETLGSVSGLQLGIWTRTGAGNYSGSFYILPDRGYNSAPNSSN